MASLRRQVASLWHHCKSLAGSVPGADARSAEREQVSAAGGKNGSSSARLQGLVRLCLSGRSSRNAAPDNLAGTGSLRTVPGRGAARRRRILAAIVIAGAAAAGYASFGLREPDPSRLSRIPGINSTPGGARQAESEHYRQTLMDANSINADAAAESGSSYISIPEALPERIDQSRPAPASGPASAAATVLSPDPVAAANSIPTGIGRNFLPEDGRHPANSDRMLTEGATNSGEYPGIDSHTEAMIRQMAAITRSLVIGTPEGVVLVREGDTVRGEAMAAPDSGALENEAGPEGSGRVRSGGDVIPIPAGTVLYGETLTTLTSDLPSPVVVEVSEGPLAGSRLVGSFSVADTAGGLEVRFGRLSRRNGVEVGIDAIAIDGFDSRALISGEVDSRLIERFGPGVLASLVSGFAESASRPKVELAGIGDSIVAATGKSTARESFIAGIGRAAEQVAAGLSARTPSAPEIILPAGHPVGILFLTLAEIPN